MDSSGRIYEGEALARAVAEGRDLVPIEGLETADALKRLNRRARRVYFAEVRRGASPRAALRLAVQFSGRR